MYLEVSGSVLKSPNSKLLFSVLVVETRYGNIMHSKKRMIILSILKPIWSGLFEGGLAWGGGGGGWRWGGKCPRPVTLKLLMIMK